ncbi:MAG: hypothetical protein SXG53_14145 [Pseudomonadota bacterium]|nr:hypothetical protein [Pseudomonadota bacterium]
MQVEVTERLAYRLHCDCGMPLPEHLVEQLGRLNKSDSGGIWGQRLSSTHWSIFFAEHRQDHGAYAYVTHDAFVSKEGSTRLSMKLRYHGYSVILRGIGKDIFTAISDALGLKFEVICCSLCAEALSEDNVAFVEILLPDGLTTCGLGVHENDFAAEIKAMLAAVNHALNQGTLNDEMLVAASTESPTQTDPPAGARC